jgi:predicted Zn-dependent protease
VDEVISRVTVQSAPGKSKDLDRGERKRIDNHGVAVNLPRMGMERILLAAQGYIELEMPEEALAELDQLPVPEQDREEVLQLRLFILMRGQRWTQALDVCARLRALFPGESTGYIHGAFCLHEAGRTAEAKTLLLSGPPDLAKEATFFYNLGCYDAVLGNMVEAAAALRTSFEMDKKFREIAKADPDLKSVSGLF